MLALSHVSVQMGGRPILHDASLTIAPKDCVCIVGPAGSGKSLILRLLLRLQDPDTGELQVDGVSLKEVPAPIVQLYRRRIGTVFDHPILCDSATAEENIALPLLLAGAPERMVQRNVQDLIQAFGLEHVAQALPCTLSDGEQRCVAFARALAGAPMMLFLDEPISVLDAKHAAIATELVRAMHRKGTTIVATSRTAETAHALGARVVEIRQHGLHAAKAAHATKRETSHRILEEAPQQPQPSEAHSPKQPSSQAASSSRKIRVTSIGSQLVDREDA